MDAPLVDLLERLLAATSEHDTTTRARLLATLAEARYYEADADTRAMALHAVELAERAGDPALLVDVLFEAFLALWRPQDVELYAGLGKRLVTVAARSRLSPEIAIAGRTIVRAAHLTLGRSVDPQLGADLATVATLRLPFLHAQLLWQDGGLALARGESGPARRRNVEAAALVERATSYGWATSSWYLAPSVIRPKPVRREGPEVLLAAYTAAGLDRVARRADGWTPADVPLDAVAWMWSTVLDLALSYGRQPDRLRLVVRANVRSTERRLDSPRAEFAGSVDQIGADVVRARQLGAHELLLDLHGSGQTPVAMLDLARRIRDAAELRLAS